VSFDVADHRLAPGGTLTATALDDALREVEETIGTNGVAGQGLLNEDIKSFPNGLLANTRAFVEVPFTPVQIAAAGSLGSFSDDKNRWPPTTIELTIDATLVGFRVWTGTGGVFRIYKNGIQLATVTTVALVALSSLVLVFGDTRFAPGDLLTVCAYTSVPSVSELEIETAEQPCHIDLVFEPIF
jgi:hypothetical protein